MYIARARCESQLAVGSSGLNACWSCGWAIEFNFLAWSSIAQSVCLWAFSLLEIRFQRPCIQILHLAEEDNLSLFDLKIACLCQSIEINNNRHVYCQSQLRKRTSSVVEWPQCLLILGIGRWVQVFSLILDSSVGIQSGFRFGFRDPGFQSCIQYRKTTCLFTIRKSLACAGALKLTTNKLIYTTHISKIIFLSNSDVILGTLYCHSSLVYSNYTEIQIFLLYHFCTTIVYLSSDSVVCNVTFKIAACIIWYNSILIKSLLSNLFHPFCWASAKYGPQ